MLLADSIERSNVTELVVDPLAMPRSPDLPYAIPTRFAFSTLRVPLADREPLGETIRFCLPYRGSFGAQVLPAARALFPSPENARIQSELDV